MTAAFFAGDLVTYIGVTILLLIVGQPLRAPVGQPEDALDVAAGAGRRHGRSASAWSRWPTRCSTGSGRTTWPPSRTVGASPLIAGLLMAFSGGLSALWRRRIRVGVLTVCLVALLYGGQLQDVLRMSTALVGLPSAPCSCTPGRGSWSPTPSRRETRVLVAVVIAATALGPILVAITGEIEGPLSALADLYVGPKAYSDEDRDLADILMALCRRCWCWCSPPGCAAAGGSPGGRPWSSTSLLLALGALLRDRLLRVGRRERPAGRGFQLGRLAAAARPAAARCHRPAGAHPAVVHRAGAGRRLPQARADACSVSSLALWAVFVLARRADRRASSRRTPTVGELSSTFPIAAAAQRLSLHHRAVFRADHRVSARYMVDWMPVIVWAVILSGLLRSFVAARVESDAEDRGGPGRSSSGAAPPRCPT